MRTTILLVFGTLSVCAVLWAAPEKPQKPQKPQKPEWKKVNDAIDKQLPQTAIKELEPLIKAALETKNYAEAVKAVALKISLEGTIQGSKPAERITRLEAAMKDLPDEMQPLLEAILGHWYWDFFQQNRWRIHATDRRRPTAGRRHQLLGPEADPGRNRRALHGSPAERSGSAADTHREIRRAAESKGTMPDATRPTLYDFLVHEALTFYTAGEQAGAMVQDAFVLQADSPIFAPTAEFLAWNIESPDTDSPVIKAIRLFQKLAAFHQEDQDPTALAEAESRSTRVRLQPSRRGREEHTATRPRCSGSSSNGAANPSRPGHAKRGAKCCAANANWSKPARWRCARLGEVPRHRGRQPLLQPDSHD